MIDKYTNSKESLLLTNSNNNSDILLVGAGNIAIDYVKILKELSLKFVIVGRGLKSVSILKEKTGISAYVGGLRSWIKENNRIPKIGIIAVNVDQLADCAMVLINNGVKRILLEKPGGINLEEIKEVALKAKEKNISIFIAYNRRFYTSTLKAQDIINNDGGVISFHIEFTEWLHNIENLDMSSKVKKQLFYWNSTHVLDLAFYLGGKPKLWSTYTSGGISWLPDATIFTGAGITIKNSLFSYHTNWESPGRWKLEIMTKKHRLLFAPLEKLKIQKLKSLDIEEVELDDKIDQDFKPGLFLQVKSFIEELNYYKMIAIQEHKEMWENIYTKIIAPDKE